MFILCVFVCFPFAFFRSSFFSFFFFGLITVCVCQLKCIRHYLSLLLLNKEVFSLLLLFFSFVITHILHTLRRKKNPLKNWICCRNCEMRFKISCHAYFFHMPFDRFFLSSNLFYSLLFSPRYLLFWSHWEHYMRVE